MTITAVTIAAISLESHESGFGLNTASPRLSWRFGATDTAWVQAGYEVGVTRNGKEELHVVESSSNVLVPWPCAPLTSRERVVVRVRARGADGGYTPWISITAETALLRREDWKAKMISCPARDIDVPKRPFRLVKRFSAPKGTARIYATAQGLYTLTLNGVRVGDHVLAPGWQSYASRLAYQVYDISNLLQAENEMVADIGEGWFAGRLHRPGRRNVWGSRLGLLAQIEVDGQVVEKTDGSWSWAEGDITNSEIYNGETVDTRLDTRVQGPAEVLPFPTARLVAPHAPPVRRVMEVHAKEVITTPSGAKVLDFGQNLVGWLRINRQFDGPGELRLRHAEVMEDGELGVRPLRTAMCTDTLTLGGTTLGWEPKFTFHGFRYAEVTGVEFGLEDFTAIVIASDLRPTGTFSCSHALLNQLHANVVWGMRGNFVSVPTDCPQRDERLGWTGDLQVFAPTASFLADTSAMLSEWMQDVEAEQVAAGGCVPVVIPWVPPSHSAGPIPRPHAVWGDVTALTPRDLYTAFGDTQILERQFSSMCLWLDKGIPRGSDGFWDQNIRQYGDWLDPRAPPEFPAHGGTDTHLVANAYLVHVTAVVARIAEQIGKTEQAAKYAKDAARLRALFRQTYITERGRMASDTQTAYALALAFDLLEPEQVPEALARLEFLIRFNGFKISTGFAGTPLILPVLARHGLTHLAYRMLQERDNPSWLYSVRMGATTIWERWDSMTPDGRINPGSMTSFNHYALGSVATFLHATVGGLAPEMPGWRRALVRPQPGGTITSARVQYDSAYGVYAVDWEIKDGTFKVNVAVPPNAEAHVVLPGIDEIVPSGKHAYALPWTPDPRWPPTIQVSSQSAEMPDEFVP